MSVEAMHRTELERQLRWLMTLRVVIVTTLLISAFSIELLFSPAQSLRPLFLVAAASYGMVLIYAVLDRWLRGRPGFAVVQLVGDALIITCFVHITGGLDSPMSFLYMLPVTVAATMLHRSGALVLAGVCFLAYTGLIIFGATWSLLGGGRAGLFEHEPGRVVYFMVAHLVAMVAVALLASSLSRRLQIQGRELVERRGAVDRLKALNEDIIESINSGLITTDLGGNINFINRGGTEIMGLSAAEVSGRPIDELLGLASGFRHEVRKRLVAERRVRFEQYFETGGGGRIFLGIAVSNLFDKTMRPLGYIFIFQDLTEIQALETEVRLRERMAALGEMAAGMAHELRNPLAAISGAVQYLKGDLRPAGETLELMDIILRESQRLDHAIRDFLTFTRPGEFRAESTNLVRLIDDNIKLLRKSAEFAAEHRVVTRYAAPRMDFVVDHDRMRQIFWNLATNALKAMPEGGTLTVSVDWVDDGEQVEICFVDEGVGMDERERARYFQPFSSSFREGTGLGAAIVYRLVEEHEGNIQLESSSGRGTCVRIVLPGREPGSASLAVAVGG